jgi:VWFA-related protein
MLITLCLAALIAFGSNSQQPDPLLPLAASAQTDIMSSRLQQTGQKPPVNQQDRPQGQTAISVSVDMVSLQALVTDKKGNIITGLQPQHFTVYEDGVKQEISSFAPVDAGITVVMLVEYSKQVSWFIYEVWEAIYGFANTLRPEDWVAVIGYDIRPTILTDFTQNRMELSKALRRFNTPAFSESNLADALIFSLESVEEVEGKVAILLVSTGLDTFSKHTYDDALDMCRYANASVYAIGLGQNLRLRYEDSMGALTRTEFLLADNRLRSFAELTGGHAYFPRFVTEYPSIFNNISIMLRNQYSIGYVSSNSKKDGKFRKIRLEVNVDVDKDGKPDKLEVLTRKGYKVKEG